MPSATSFLSYFRSFRRQLSDRIHDRSRPLLERRYLRLVSRHWLLIAGVLALFILGGLLWARLTTPLYRASATIQIDPDDPEVLPYQEVSANSSYSDRESEEYLLTAAANLASRPIAERVVERLDLSAEVLLGRRGASGSTPEAPASPEAPPDSEDPDAAADAVDVLLANLQTNVPRKTRLVEISFRAPDPALAAEVVDASIDEFIGQRLERRNQDAAKAIEFLRQRLDELTREIETSRAELMETARSDFQGVTDGASTTVDKLDDLSRELTTIENELSAMAFDYGLAVRATVDDLPPSLATPSILELERRLQELEREDARLASSFGPNWPQVQELRSQIARIRGQLRAEKQEAIDSIKLAYERALDRRQRVEAALAEQRRRVEQLNVDSLRYGMLERGVKAREELHNELLDRMVEAYAEVELTTSNIHVVAPASVGNAAVYPPKKLGLLLAAGLGLLAGLGLAMALESVDDRLRDELDVAALRLPLVGSIPYERREKRLEGRSPSLLLGENPRPEVDTTALQTSSARSWEAFRALRASILGPRSRDDIPRTIMVTSPRPGNGTTRTVAHVGVVLARTGARTLMVDLNLRDPALDRRWPIVNVNGGGVSALLEGYEGGAAALVQSTDTENLYILPAGSPTPRSVDLLDSDRLEPGIQALRGVFDFIIFDTPSLHEVTDALIVSRYADAVLLVASARESSKGEVRNAGARLESAGARILGVVLNRADPA